MIYWNQLPKYTDVNITKFFRWSVDMTKNSFEVPLYLKKLSINFSWGYRSWIYSTAPPHLGEITTKIRVKNLVESVWMLFRLEIVVSWLYHWEDNRTSTMNLLGFSFLLSLRWNIEQQFINAKERLPTQFF